MRALALVLLPLGALYLGSCLVGCTVRLSDGGTAWVEIANRIEIGHTAQSTDSQSEAELDLQPAVDYVIDLAALNTNGG